MYNFRELVFTSLITLGGHMGIQSIIDAGVSRLESFPEYLRECGPIVMGRLMRTFHPMLHGAAIKLEYPVSDSCWIAARVLEDSATYRSRQVNLRAIHQARGTRHGD